ncbi:MAG TPA: MFS transporter, partial [Mesotoga infera]|nr:MFS transporter [Mesotoga infera]
MKKSRARIVLFLMLFMMVFLNADQMVMSPNIGEIEAEFAITKADIGLIQGSFTIVGALVSLAWGFLADKYNRKLLLLLSVLVGEIPCFLSAFVQSFPQLFITRALTGIGVGALFPVVFSFAGDTFKESHRPKVNAFLSTAIS